MPFPRRAQRGRPLLTRTRVPSGSAAGLHSPEHLQGQVTAVPGWVPADSALCLERRARGSAVTCRMFGFHFLHPFLCLLTGRDVVLGKFMESALDSAEGLMCLLQFCQVPFFTFRGPWKCSFQGCLRMHFVFFIGKRSFKIFWIKFIYMYKHI